MAIVTEIDILIIDIEVTVDTNSDVYYFFAFEVNPQGEHSNTHCVLN